MWKSAAFGAVVVALCWTGTAVAAEEALPAPAPQTTAPPTPRPAIEPRKETSPEGESPSFEDGEFSAQCDWLGKRIISLLVRDDAMGANDFTPFYLRFACPEDHLAKAFGCVITNLPMVENGAVGEQITACWSDPRHRAKTLEPTRPTVPEGQKPGNQPLRPG